ncbi:16S rRNA (cytidine(1402)-2'-O)-methyltransferase, partial [bacterium]|nr:16S rRNA (cytidine(1402)-2'-O)-methyltransferase [bacterium]
MGILYSVALPIGNLQDITLRALDILKNVDYIACEDTRNTKILLNKYDICTKLIDCHKFNEKEKSIKIIELLKNDNTIALVSDAGTPGICDPGSVLELELLKNGHKIVPIPGACAIATFLSAVPRDEEFFTFVGFLPRTKALKEDIFFKFSNINCVFYESPNRLMNTLNDICEYFGNEKKIAVGRELTKIYEEIKIGTVKEILEYYQQNILKDEIIGMIYADKNDNPDFSQ